MTARLSAEQLLSEWRTWLANQPPSTSDAFLAGKIAARKQDADELDAALAAYPPEGWRCSFCTCDEMRCASCGLLQSLPLPPREGA